MAGPSLRDVKVDQPGMFERKLGFTKNYIGRLSSVRNFRVESCLIPDS